MAGGQVDPSAISGAGDAIGAQASGIAGTAANMPTWQKGLMGAVTGDKSFGPNAPLIHSMLGGLLSPRPQMQQPNMPHQMGGQMGPTPGMPQMPMGPGMQSPQQPQNPMLQGLPSPWGR